ncbi:MAG: hypothetical protein MJ231_01905, partial [bacterium]|nr:hypothetical protein [bacterium]
MDYGNYGKYLYNLQTGQTVGVKKEEDNNNVGNGKTVEQNGETWNMIGNDLNPNQKYGTVEDLSFEQLCNLFLQGNLEVDEFVKGLESKSGSKSVEDINNGMDKEIYDINVVQENGTVTVTFKAKNWNVYNGKACNPGRNAYTTYTLTCSIDASESQTDKKVENTISEEVIKLLACNYGIAEDDIQKLFSEVKSDNGYYCGKSNLSAKLYKINNGMTVQELEEYLSKEYKTDINSKFSKVTLADAGITQTLLAKYFQENNDGTYSIKPNCVTDDGKPITCLDDIRDTYNSGSKPNEDFLEKFYGKYM